MVPYEILDSRFRAFVLPNAPLLRLADGFAWLEGPVWFADHECLIFSYLPNDRLGCWSESGGFRVWRSPSGYTNGNTHDRQGRLISCSHRGRCVTRTEGPNGLAFSPDERLLYVAESGALFAADPEHHIRVFPPRQSSVRGGRRRAMHCTGWHEARPPQGPPSRRQPHLRRPQSLSPVHLRVPQPVRDLHEPTRR
jgi:sugar lactone lactonase YvrE